MTLDLSLSPETRALADALRAVPLGGTASYAELSRVVGYDVARRRGALESARRIALRDDGAAFLAVRGIGLRRLPPEDAPELGRAARRKIGRRAADGMRAMVALSRSGNGLPDGAARQMTAELAALGLIREAARDKSLTVPPQPAAPPPPAVAARNFIRLLGGDPEAAE